MDVNVIFKNKIPFDNDKNFIVDFKDQKEIISVLLNKKKDYFLSNAITYLKEIKNEIKKDKDIHGVKKFQDVAKKHIEAFNKNTFDTPFTKNFKITFGDDWFITPYRPTYYFKLQTDLMKNFFKTYQYYNAENDKIQNFKVYNPLEHFTFGLIYDLDTSPAPTSKRLWPAPVNSFTFKLTNQTKTTSDGSSEKEIIAYVNQKQGSKYLETINEWKNKMIIIDTINLKLITSDTGWVKEYNAIIKQGGMSQATLRGLLASYYYERKDSLNFSHRENFKNLSDDKKELVYFIVEPHGYLKVNFGYRKHLYIGDDLKKTFTNGFLRLCSKPNGSISKRNIDIYKSDFVIPYKRLYRYTIISEVPSDNVWVNLASAVVDGHLNVSVKYQLTDAKYDALTDQTKDPIFPTDLKSYSYTYYLTDAKINQLKNYNNYDDKVKDIKAIKLSREHSYFLYDRKSLIRDTFVTELNKKIYLIGSISFYDKENSDGKSFLVRSDTKLKFDFKENQVVENLIFNLSHTYESAKILLKDDNIHNLLLISTEKLMRVGQKKKMVEIVDKILVKALQNYDKYTTLNPLEVNQNSNYLSKIIHDYKGYIFEVRLINVLFSSNITNDTQNIFITCQNLTSAKKALINDKIYYLLEINEIKQWNEMKGKSLYVNAKIDDSHYMQTAKHFGFAFKTSFPTEFLEFTCEFLDDQAKKIEFAGGEEKVPIIDLEINIIK